MDRDLLKGLAACACAILMAPIFGWLIGLATFHLLIEPRITSPCAAAEIGRAMP